MSDLIERLRNLTPLDDPAIGDEAADRIEALEISEETDRKVILRQQDEIEQLQGANKILGQWVEDKDKHIEQLTEIKDLAIKDCMAEAAENERLTARVHELESSQQVNAKKQWDAACDAHQHRIETLTAENTKLKTAFRKACSDAYRYSDDFDIEPGAEVSLVEDITVDEDEEPIIGAWVHLWAWIPRSDLE